MECLRHFCAETPKWREFKKKNDSDRSSFYAVIKSRLCILGAMRVRYAANASTHGGSRVPFKNEPRSPVGAYSVAVRPRFYTGDCRDDLVFTVRCTIWRVV